MTGFVQQRLGALLLVSLVAGCSGGATIGAAPGPIAPTASASVTFGGSPSPSGSPSPGGSASPSAAPTTSGAPSASPTAVNASPMPVVQPTVGKGGGSPSPAGATPTPTASPATPSATPTGATPTPTPPGAQSLPPGQYIYVTNRGVSGAGNDASSTVTVYPVTATGNATPIATLAGPSTNLVASQYPAVDTTGRVYVSNSAQGFKSGTLTEYTNDNGNNTPVTTLSNMFTPEGVSFDAAGNLYVAQIDGVYVYPPGATSSTAYTARLTGGDGNNRIYNPYEVFVNKNGKIYVALQNQIEVFAANARDNTALLQNIYGAAAQTYYILGVAADSSDNVYATNGPLNNVVEFNTSANNSTASAAGPAPSSVIVSTSFNDPWGITIDASDNVYVVNHGNNSILYFAAGSFQGGIPTRTISGANTGLNNPIGIYVR